MKRLGMGACWSLSACVTVSLAGCGAGPVAPPMAGPVAPSASTLSGNWLLAGVLPDRPAAPGTTPAPGLAVTFDVNGSQATGIASYELSCGAILAGSESVVSGSVAADGSFTLQTPTPTSGLLATAVTLKGTVPAQSGGAWAGSYSIVSAASSCPGTVTGSIAAQPVGMISGVYAGSASVSQSLGTAASTVVFKATLQQGGTQVLGGKTTPFTNTTLAGTVSVQGSPCFTSGTTVGATLPSAVEGSTVLANFLMNDGSNLVMLGSIRTLDSSQLGVLFTGAFNGTCTGLVTPVFSLSR